MIDTTNQTRPDDRGSANESPSNDILKLEVDDLFHEIEQVKRRLDRLEGQAGRGGAGMPEWQNPPTGNVSDPDR